MKYNKLIASAIFFLGLITVATTTSYAQNSGVRTNTIPKERPNPLVKKRPIKVTKTPIVTKSYTKSQTSKPYGVTLKRVRRCFSVTDNNGYCVTGKTSDEFIEWKNSRVQTRVQQDTYIAPISIPDIKKVEQVVFVSAGQQIEPNLFSWGDGYPNVLTGQSDNYKDGCKDLIAECERSMDGRSLAVKLIRSGKFDMDKTLFIVAFDARMQWEKNANELQKIENAYWSYLTNKFDAGLVKQIVLSGQSRGGCLSYRLAKRLRNTDTHKNIPLIVQGYDPVCHRGELGKSDKTTAIYGNPLNPLFNSIGIDMAKVFLPNKRKNLALLNIHAGGTVGGMDIRSFTYKPQNIDLTWWKQTWVNYEHTDMGGNFNHQHNTVIPGYQHIMDKLALFSSYKAPGATGNVLNNKCKQPFPTSVGNYTDGKPVCKAVLVNKITKTKCIDRSAPGQVWNNYCIWRKNNYWHARTLKAEKDKGLKCSASLPRRVGDLKGKPVCQAALVNKLTPTKCSKQKGMKWNGYCLWGKQYLWHARRLKAESKPLKCSAQFPRKVGDLKGKPVCQAALANKIKPNKCSKKKGMKWNGYCLWGKKYLWHARKLK